MLNWLARIGWSHGDQEIFSRDEIARSSTSTRCTAPAPRPTRQSSPGCRSTTSRRCRASALLRASCSPSSTQAAGHPVESSPGLERARRPAARAQPHARRDGRARALLPGAEPRLRREGGARSICARRSSRPSPHCTTDSPRSRSGASLASRRSSSEVRAAPRRPAARQARAARARGHHRRRGLAADLRHARGAGQGALLGRIAEALHYLRHG